MERGKDQQSLIAESMRAHALMFERPLAPAHAGAVGARMLAAFVVVAIGLFFALRWLLGATGMRGMPGTNLLFVATLLAAFVLVQHRVVRAPMSAIGLRRWGDWTHRERLYFLQVVPTAALLFAFIFRGHLQALIERHGVPGFLLLSVLTGLLWGIVQEFLYRGWLQTELARRFGAVAGLLVANAVFAFGPLHLDYLLAPQGVRWGGLAAIFGIGLVFALVYQRSGNLWIPAILHGLWPLNMT